MRIQGTHGWDNGNETSSNSPFIIENGDSVMLSIPMSLKKRAGREEIIVPEGMGNADPSVPGLPADTFAEARFRGIGCNRLVCLAAWMAISAHQTSGKILAIFFPIMAFVALGFGHCVANMYFIPSALF